MVGRGISLRNDRNASPSEGTGNRSASNGSLLLRNYDDDSAHDIRVRVTDHDGEVVFTRTVTVTPRETVSVRTSLDRGVYRVDAELESGATARADCLLGSDPGERVMIETGNGLVSVAEGPF
jgi:hypothetical protein